MRYTIEEMRMLKHRYLEPLYEGFSLQHVFESRKALALSLRRSDNAYTIKKAADTREEYSRQVRREMNKLTEANFEIVLDALKSRPRLLVKEYRDDMVRIIHQKALAEPECSKNYAAACRDLADFETTLTTAKPAEKPKSAFRNDLVALLKSEFERSLNEPSPTDEELGVTPQCAAAEREELQEECRASRMRRKLANIRFIGQLYLHDVFSWNTMVTILGSILSQNNGKPAADNIEVILQLLTTIGERLSKEQSGTVNKAMEQLDRIKDQYPLRIKFMVMDLLDLQKNNWKPKNPVGSPTTAASPQALESKGRGGATAAKRFGGGPPAASTSWRDVAKKDSGPAAPSKAVVTAKASTASSSAKRSVPVSPQQTVVLPFHHIVETMQADWVERCDNDFISGWVESFNHCDQLFQSVVELGEAVATEVILKACKTTQPNAQQAAAGFCSVGLDLSDEEILGGFTNTLGMAVDEDLIADCPRFPERWMAILGFTSGNPTDLYFDLGSICRDAYCHKIEVAPGGENDADEEEEEGEFERMLQSLRAFWQRLEPPPEGEVLGSEAILGLITKSPSPAKEGLDKVLAAYLFHLHTMGALESDVLLSDLPWRQPLAAAAAEGPIVRRAFGAGGRAHSRNNIYDNIQHTTTYNLIQPEKKKVKQIRNKKTNKQARQTATKNEAENNARKGRSQLYSMPQGVQSTPTEEIFYDPMLCSVVFCSMGRIIEMKRNAKMRRQHE
eukprot:gene7554-5329_t